MTRPSVRMEDTTGGEHWVIRDRGGAFVGMTLPDRSGWHWAVDRAVKVAEAQPVMSRPPLPPSVQRSITDVGLRVYTHLGEAGRHSEVEFYPPGRALYMLRRFGDQAKFDAGKSPLYCKVVEGVDPRTEGR